MNHINLGRPKFHKNRNSKKIEKANMNPDKDPIRGDNNELNETDIAFSSQVEVEGRFKRLKKRQLTLEGSLLNIFKDTNKIVKSVNIESIVMIEEYKKNGLAITTSSNVTSVVFDSEKERTKWLNKIRETSKSLTYCFRNVDVYTEFDFIDMKMDKLGRDLIVTDYNIYVMRKKNKTSETLILTSNKLDNFFSCLVKGVFEIILINELNLYKQPLSENSSKLDIITTRGEKFGIVGESEKLDKLFTHLEKRNSENKSFIKEKLPVVIKNYPQVKNNKVQHSLLDVISDTEFLKGVNNTKQSQINLSNYSSTLLQSDMQLTLEVNPDKQSKKINLLQAKEKSESSQTHSKNKNTENSKQNPHFIPGTPYDKNKNSSNSNLNQMTKPSMPSNFEQIQRPSMPVNFRQAPRPPTSSNSEQIPTPPTPSNSEQLHMPPMPSNFQQIQRPPTPSNFQQIQRPSTPISFEQSSRQSASSRISEQPFSLPSQSYYRQVSRPSTPPPDYLKDALNEEPHSTKTTETTETTNKPLKKEEVIRWSADNVCDWLENISKRFSQYRNIMKENQVDGEMLVTLMTEESLKLLIKEPLNSNIIWQNIRNLRSSLE